MDKKFYGIFIILLIIVAGGIYWAASLQEGGGDGPGTTDERVAFAQCLTDKGATFYGAWWCPHCAAQKDMFGERAMEAVTYAECATPSGKGQTAICQQKNIKSYPTWIFADGSRKTGVLTFGVLSEKTGCVAPGATATEKTDDIGESSNVGTSTDTEENTKEKESSSTAVLEATTTGTTTVE